MSIIQKINHIQHDIAEILASTERPHDAVRLLAVSKRQSIAAIEQAAVAGINDFGESYLQEALPKISALTNYSLTWHFIGPIQSNKTKAIATHFDWVHGVSREKIARALNEHRPDQLPLLNVCIQVNLDQEAQKEGITPTAVCELAQSILQLPRLNLRGLMCIPQPTTDPLQQYRTFSRLSQLLQMLNQQLNLTLDTLSMGMSHDYAAAIRAGSTIVRIGQGIFGQRSA